MFHIKKLIFFLLVFSVIFTECCSFFSFAEETTIFDLTDEPTISPAWDTMREGDSFSIQFNITTSIKSFNLRTFKTEEGSRNIKVSVYKWNENNYDSIKENALYEKLFENFENENYLVFDFEKDFGNTLNEGEYLINYTIISGDYIVVERIKPSLMGVRCYDNCYSVYGNYYGYVETSKAVSSVFKAVSSEKNYPYNTAAPEVDMNNDERILSKDVNPSSWAFEDGLGRTADSYGKIGESNDKTVGLFYWTWHLGQNGGNTSSYPKNINNIVTEHPESTNDYNSSVWSEYGGGANFWNEPIYGYYIESDDYVLRKHAELLADAGVDFVIFDCTNGDATWEEAYLNLLRVWSDAREDGVKTPQISFMLNFDPSSSTVSSLKQIYNAIYKDGKYQDLWFYWEGKPLVMAWDTCLDDNLTLEAEIKNFFTFRGGVATYFGGDQTDDMWGWLSVYPQACYYNEDGSVEMTTVGIAMNANYETQSLSAMNSGKNMGRSFAMDENFSYTYSYRGKKIVVDNNIENSKLYGRNFQEQWEYALSVDPEIIFITGWNEWIMGRYEEWCGVSNAFPDEFDDENSRDIEPSKGELKDYYYYQMVANIRRFKGANEAEIQSDKKTIDIFGDLSQWDDENIISYNHYANNTYVRDNNGFGATHYVNSGIRNDFVCSKVSYDSENVYFYVETVDDITSYTDENWMRLLLDTGAATKKSTDWEGFEYIINRSGATENTLIVEKSTGEWNWEVVGTVQYTISGNVMQIEVPRKLLGLKGLDVSFNFKWCDMNLTDGDIMTLYTDGDCAPGGRFTFVFSSAKENNNILLIVLSVVIIIAVILALVFVVIIKKRKNKAST